MEKTTVSIYKTDWKWITSHKQPGDTMADGLERARKKNERLEKQLAECRERLSEYEDVSDEEFKGKEAKPEEAGVA